MNYKLTNCLRCFIVGAGLSILLFLLLACAQTSANTTRLTSDQDPVQFFYEEMERLRKDNRIPGLSAAVLQNQQVVFAEGFGYADLENRIPVTADTPFNIASLSKTFAAAILMKLVEDGRLDLDAAMADILKNADFIYDVGTIHGYANVCKKIKEFSRDPDFEYAEYAFLLKNYRCDKENITIRHHLTHTAQEKPGEAYRYNGFLFGFLSLVAEEASGQPYADLLVDHIIAPLDMKNTIPSITKERRNEILAKRAKYYRMGFGGEFEPSDYPVTLSASAGMVTTVLDMAKFDVAMDHNLIVSAETKAAMFSRTISNSGKPLPYGLGWFVQEHAGVKLIWHYGWAPKAYSSLILKVPEKDVTLILFANSEGASADFQLGRGDVLRSPFAVAFLNIFTDVNW
ncbi:MAG: serine hydrolase domain-containing protein [Desulfobacterales bacterium]|jgi:CubicO group peptidase (beta-lactamase class C family)